MTAIAQLNEKLVNFEKQKKALVKELKKDLKSVLKEIFNTVPSIKSIYWTQYTPYFMDGDTCEFSINEIIVSNSKDEFVDYAGDDDFEDDTLWTDNADSVSSEYVPDAAQRKLLKDFSNIVFKSEDLIKEIFGDHVRVIGTKTGFKTEEYDHE